MWNFLPAKINVSRVHNKSLNTSACITIHTPLLLLSLIIYLSYQPAIFQFLTRLPLLEGEGPKHSIYATSLVKCSQGLDSKIKGTRVIHFSTPRGCLWDMLNYNFDGVSNVFLPWLRSWGGCIYRFFQNISIYSLILSSSMLLKEWFWP